MSIILVSAASAAGYFIILKKTLGSRILRETQVIWDILLTFGLPLLFLGTYSGMITAVLAGLMFSALTFILYRKK